MQKSLHAYRRLVELEEQYLIKFLKEYLDSGKGIQATDFVLAKNISSAIYAIMIAKYRRQNVIPYQNVVDTIAMLENWQHASGMEVDEANQKINESQAAESHSRIKSVIDELVIALGSMLPKKESLTAQDISQQMCTWDILDYPAGHFPLWDKQTYQGIVRNYKETGAEWKFNLVQRTTEGGQTPAPIPVVMFMPDEIGNIAEGHEIEFESVIMLIGGFLVFYYMAFQRSGNDFAGIEKVAATYGPIVEGIVGFYFGQRLEGQANQRAADASKEKEKAVIAKKTKEEDATREADRVEKELQDIKNEIQMIRNDLVGGNIGKRGE
jgi:hypothetical protein